MKKNTYHDTEPPFDHENWAAFLEQSKKDMLETQKYIDRLDKMEKFRNRETIGGKIFAASCALTVIGCFTLLPMYSISGFIWFLAFLYIAFFVFKILGW